MGEAKISALVVSTVTGVALTMMLAQALRDLGAALAISAPIALVMGAVLFVFANDTVKPCAGKAAPDEVKEGK